MILLQNNGLPIWGQILLGVLAGLAVFAEKLGIKEIFSKKAESADIIKILESEKAYEDRIKKLEFVIVKLVSVIKTTSQFMNNPENSEQTKQAIDNTMEEISEIMQDIEDNNKLKRDV